MSIIAISASLGHRTRTVPSASKCRRLLYSRAWPSSMTGRAGRPRHRGGIPVVHKRATSGRTCKTLGNMGRASSFWSRPAAAKPLSCNTWPWFWPVSPKTQTRRPTAGCPLLFLSLTCSKSRSRSQVGRWPTPSWNKRGCRTGHRLGTGSRVGSRKADSLSCSTASTNKLTHPCFASYKRGSRSRSERTRRPHSC